MTHVRLLLRPACTVLIFALFLGTVGIVPRTHAQHYTHHFSTPTLDIDITSTGVIDPERMSTTPTGWQWWRDRSEAQINAIRNQDQRIIDLERSPIQNNRYDVVFVDNKGTYGRSEGWWYGYTRNQVVNKVAEKNGRIIDLEPYIVNGQHRFAFSLIRNEGNAAKWWWWNYDLTPEQVAADIDKHKIRLIDLDAYVVNGNTRYSYVGVKNEGVDAKAWWLYFNVSPQYLNDRINENKARLVDLEFHNNGNVTGVMVQNNGTAWWWAFGLTQERMEEIVATTASRIIDLESYVVNGKRYFAFVSIDNANAETRRLRDLLYKAYDNPQFGPNVIRGFLVKEVNGQTYADMAGGLRFQPLSSLKLLPYLHAIIEAEKAQMSLDDVSVSWTEATVDNPSTDIDERKYASCLLPGTVNTQQNAATLTDALPTMMWDSHNRTLDAVLDKYGPGNITAHAQQLGMTQTEMYFGCPQQNGPSQPWAANRSTLYDFAKMFEGVDSLQFVKSEITRQVFYNNMINLDYDGASYTSPITGKTVGSLNNGFLRDLVKQEAGPGKQAIVEEFLQHVVIRGKGGGGGPSSNEFGYSDVLHVTLPFKENGQIVPKSFVVAWFVYKLQTPNNCPESKAMDGGACQAIWQPERDALATFRTEIHTIPIREALKTWTTSTPPIIQPPITRPPQGETNRIFLPMLVR